MSIFNNNTIVGLFASDSDVEQAIEALQNHGFGKEDDEIKVIDKNRLAQETPIKEGGRGVPVPPPTGTSGPVGPGVPTPTMEESAGAEKAVIESSTENLLIDMGIDDEEAAFYAKHVARDNSLVIVETDKERASMALDLMKRANARGTMA